MPFRSEKQRRFLWKNHPGLAREWTEKYGSAIKKSIQKVSDTHKRMKRKGK